MKNLENYEEPRVEVIEISVEQGFAASTVSGTEALDEFDFDGNSSIWN